MSLSPSSDTRTPERLKQEIRWMRRALRLAERGTTPPNPMVGCVIVQETEADGGGTLVGEGWHPQAGQPHAEIFALRAAGKGARGATVYVTLEPCSHFGRTPPCADALIAAGVRRVVAAVQDANPQVAGRGFDRLRSAGIEVEVGVLAEEAKRLNAAFFHYQTTGQPHVTLKAAMTLDGKIATRTGHAEWITGTKARQYVHRLRGQSGAVLCGIGTVLMDDPFLTARGKGIAHQPLRVVLDTHLRIPLTSRLVQSAREVPLLVCTGMNADTARQAALEAAGAAILRTRQPERVDLEDVLEELARREIISLLVEGGGEVHAAFLEQGFMHRLLWFIAPKLTGGRDAPTPVEGIGAAGMAESRLLAPFRVRRFGRDILLETYPLPTEADTG